MRPLLQALAAATLFGASTPANKLLLADLDPFQLAGLLYLGAALAMLALTARERGRTGGQRRNGVFALDAANRRRLAGAVLLGGVVAPALLLAALRTAPASTTSLLLNLEPAATALLGVAFFREHLGTRGSLGVAGIVGAGAMLSWQGGWPGFAAALLVAAACTCWGFDNQWMALIDGMTPVRSTLWKGSVAGTVNLTIGLAVAPLNASPAIVTAALAVGALSYGLSLALYLTAAQQLGATRAQGIFAGAPFAGAALSFAIFGEPLTLLQLAAIGFLAASVVALLSGTHVHPHEHDALEHVHSHRHDDGHHTHEHPGLGPETRHTHPHAHEPLVHAHPHWPDLHHRHGHGANVGRNGEA